MESQPKSERSKVSKAVSKTKNLERQLIAAQIEEMQVIAKAFQPGSSAKEILDAVKLYEKKTSGNSQKGFVLPPNNTQEYFGYRERYYGTSDTMLRQMPNIPIVSSIFNLILSEAVKFMKPTEGTYDIGFEIKPTNPNITPNAAMKKEMSAYADVLMNCGTGNSYFKTESLPNLAKKALMDSLALDRMIIQVVWDGRGFAAPNAKPQAMLAMDASTFRFASTGDTSGSGDIDLHRPSFVQIWNGGVTASFYEPELIFGIRNGSTDIYRMGYGRSELENVMSIIVAMMNAIQYNTAQFQNGSFIDKLIELKGGGMTLASNLRDALRQYSLGTDRSGGIGVVGTEIGSEVRMHDLKKNNKEMEYAKWLWTVTQIICSEYRVDPNILSLDFGTGSALIRTDTNFEEKMRETRLKCVYPLVEFFFEEVNRKFFYFLTDGKYKVVAKGLGMSRREELEYHKELVTTLCTVNEVRKMRGEPPIKGGDVILNPVFLQSYLAITQGGQESNAAVDAMEGAKAPKKDAGEDKVLKALIQSLINEREDEA